MAVLFLAPPLSLGLAEPMAQIVLAQSGATPSDEVTTEDFQAPRFDKTIDIKDNGPADPYSSTVNVSGMGGVVIDVKLILRGFSHQRPEDVSVMLQHAGRQTVVMRQAGGETALRNTNIVFDSFAAETLPDESIVGNMAYIPHDYLEATNPPFGQGAPT
jgi:hypothetical protein